MDAEESAGATRVERAGDAAAAGSAPVHTFEKPTPPERPSAQATPAGDQFNQTVNALSQLGADQVARLAVTLLDVIVSKKFGAQYALTREEQQRIVEAAVPVAELYLPDISVHPVTGLALVIGVTYMTKLPEGALAHVLGRPGNSTPPGNEVPPEATA